MLDSAQSQQVQAVNTYSPRNCAGQVAFASRTRSVPHQRSVLSACLVQKFDGQLADTEVALVNRSRLRCAYADG